MSIAVPCAMKYQQLLDIATAPGNELHVFDNGTGLVTGSAYTQGIWISGTIIALWRAEGLL